jgi:uncharacterized protein YutE (UPF0331/DUF86 family)
MVVNPDVLRKRLNKLEEYLTILERLRDYDRDAFLNDPERYGSAERFLQLAIEALSDMGHHVVADEDWGTVDRQRDVPARFREQERIGDDLEETWTRMVGFRNILVHDYLNVDRNTVYDVLQHDLDNIRRLRAVFAHFL